MPYFKIIRPHFLPTCAAAILFASCGAAIAKDPASDLDTLMLGAFQKSGQDEASPTTSAVRPQPAKRKSIAARPAGAASKPSAIYTADIPAAVQPPVAPVESVPTGGLLAAIGIVTPSTPQPSSNVAPPPAERGGLLAALSAMAIKAAETSAVDAVEPVTEVPVSPSPVVAAKPVVAKPQRATTAAVAAPSPAIRPAPPVLPQEDPLPETTASIGMRTTAQMPVSYNAPPMSDPEYHMDSGDKLRIVVYGQEGLTNTYAIDAGGGITMPLIGRVVARGMTPVGLAAHVTARLRRGYIREPSVAVEVESYRPFFILGEVAAPGQYPYVPNMSVEAAVAIAGGFSPRARRDSVMLTQKVNGGQSRETVPLGTPLNPGDTIMVGERWF